jgi:GNAT superfamily N-acetyltransferase
MEKLDPITLTIRSAMPSEYDLCLAFDHTVSTEYVWQMFIDENDGTQSISFRTARLPRSMKVLYPRIGEALVQSWRLHAAFLVAEWEKLAVGYVNIREEPAQETAWVADLVVDGPYRRQGVGKALLNAAWKWAAERKLRRLIVETQTKNYPAIRFLQRNGLVFCGYNDLYYPNQDIGIFFGLTLR